MATDKQIEANRLNAQKSTGPRTPDGKAAAARNSRTHGLCVTDLTLLEDPTSHDEIESLLNRYLDHYQPSDPDEEDVIEEIVTCKIRLRHLLRIENGIINESREYAFAHQNYKDAAGTTCYRFDRQHYPPEEHRTLDNLHLAAAWEIAQDTLLNLSRYEGRVLARYRRALDRWKEIKKARAAQPRPADLAKAPADVAQAHLPAGLDTPGEPLKQSPPPNPAAQAAQPIAQNEPNSPLTRLPAMPADPTDPAKTPPEAA